MCPWVLKKCQRILRQRQKQYPFSISISLLKSRVWNTEVSIYAKRGRWVFKLHTSTLCNLYFRLFTVLYSDNQVQNYSNQALDQTITIEYCVNSNLHVQNSECRSSAPSTQWCILSQTKSLSIQVSVEHWKPLWQPYWAASLKAVIIILKPFSLVPHESVTYLRVT